MSRHAFQKVSNLRNNLSLGLAYEKKSKKKASDVQEEHARYINLISTLGPEISQETQWVSNLLEFREINC